MASWGPGWSGEELWAGSLVVCVLGGGDAVPYTHSLYQLLSDPASPVFKGQAMGLCDPFSPPPCGLPCSLGVEKGRDFPLFLAPTE